MVGLRGGEGVGGYDVELGQGAGVGRVAVGVDGAGVVVVSDKPVVEIVPIESLQPDPGNANIGTERGSYMLNDSLTERGAGRSILATGDGVILAGNKTHEQAVQAGFTEVIKVHTTGKQLVAVVRDDLEHGDPEATRLALEDNRIGQESLKFDPVMLLSMAQDDGTLTDGLWRDDEWEELLGDLLEEPPIDLDGNDGDDEAPQYDQYGCPKCGFRFSIEK